ncbi:MAG TPA: SDR family NAD(P)-dependent oxidoreductase, partial [Acidimicrobiales bacterium]|nr:SDR family NAD(P)-dependent oxidoreductase [Acidimicrobiales bacterium]
GMVRLNVLALTRLTRAALGVMTERGSGAIVNVGSIAGAIAGPNLAVYAATKAYVGLFTESLAEELRGSGVHVQALLPGVTRTGFQEAAGDVGNELPSFLWQEADAVADACLAGLRRGRTVVVSGVHNKAFVAAASVLPSSLARRVAGIASRARGRDKTVV